MKCIMDFKYFAGLARQAEVEKERREEAKKHEDKMVPTEWQAELQDKRLVGSITQNESQLIMCLTIGRHQIYFIGINICRRRSGKG